MTQEEGLGRNCRVRPLMQAIGNHQRIWSGKGCQSQLCEVQRALWRGAIGTLDGELVGREIIPDAAPTVQERDGEELRKFKHQLDVC